MTSPDPDGLCQTQTDRSLSITPVGIGVVGGAAVLTAVGWILAYTVLVGIGLAALLVAAFAAVTTRSVPPIEVERIIEPTLVQRGQPAHGLVSVRNPTGRPTSPCSARDRVVELDGGGDGRTVDVAVPRLRRGQSVAVPYRLPTSRRGVLRVGPLTLDRRDPLGLFVAARTVGDAVEVTVEPRVIAVDPRPTGRLRHLEGPNSDSAQNGTLTFHSLREYARGDDVRRIHWPSTARTGTLMVREQVDTSQPSTVVVLDTRASRFDEDTFEEAVDVAASMVAASERRGFPTRLVTSAGDDLAVHAGQSAQELRALIARVRRSAAPDGDDVRDDLGVATSLVVGRRDRDAIVVVSGAVDRTDLGQISVMCRRFERPTLVTIRPAASGADGHDAPTWSDGPHIDGADAPTAMRRWQSGAVGGRR